MPFLSAAVSPPRAKKVAQPMNIPQLRMKPASGLYARYVGTPPRTPILTDSAIRLDI